MKNKRISTSELDFDGIKQSLKTFLQGQEKFSDYDFEGSGLSILLDVLAYNTHYNALYQNLAINESFLDSASKRNSVVSKAKELSYIPYSRRCSQAFINITITLPVSSTLTYVELPKYTPFSATGEGKSYTFYSTDSHIGYVTSNNRTITFQNVNIKEGSPLQYRFVVGQDSKYIIANTNVDLDTLIVTVQETLTSSKFEYFKNATDIIDVDGTSLVYFVKEIDNGYYQLDFGDDVIGKALVPGNVITCEYVSTAGPDANNISRFTYAGPLFATGQNVVISARGPSFGGSDPESIESIKYNAPHYYTAQNRCVTVQDYKSMILNKFPEARHVSVWGGEEFKNIRDRKYGNVYLSVVTKDGVPLTSTEKQYILTDVLKHRQMMSIHPVFIDSVVIRLQLDVFYKFDPTKTSLSAGAITTNVVNNIRTYNDVNLFKFNGAFKYSNIINVIDKSDPSIINSNINIKMVYNVPIFFNQSSRYTITFFNKIFNYETAKESIISSGIYTSESPYVCYIDDVPETSSMGQLRLFYYYNQQKVLVRYIGIIDYSTGQLDIDLLNIVKSSSSYFSISAIPASHDVDSYYNYVINIDPHLLSVTPINVRGNSNLFMPNVV